jgi:hypothetical protein
MDDYTPQITADGGTWAETEVLGGYALVKVRAAQTTLNTIAGVTGFQRIPLSVLTSPLSSLTTAQRNAIRTTLGNMGFTPAEILAAAGSNAAQMGTHTLGEILRFAAQRRLKPRYDAAQDQIVLDGPSRPCRPIAEVDAAITG